MGVITINEYAKQRGISVQAVNQTVKRYQADIADHIVKQGKTRFLDDEAVAFLDGHRKYATPIVDIRNAQEGLDQVEVAKHLLKENEELLNKLSKAYDMIISVKEENIKLVAENGELRLLIAKKDAEATAEPTEATTAEDNTDGVETYTAEETTPQQATEAPTAPSDEEGVEVSTEEAEAPQQATDDVKADAEPTAPTTAEAPKVEEAPTKKQNRFVRAWKELVRR